MAAMLFGRGAGTFLLDYLNHAAKHGKEVVITLKSLHWNTHIKNIRMLGSNETIEWSLSRNGLDVKMPSGAPSELAVTLRIEKSYGSQ